MKLFNTLSRKKEEFGSLHGKNVSFYACGPTVYDVAHIGNLRTYLFEDVLKRVLLNNGFVVKHVMNITDVDDKTIKKSAGKKSELLKITKKYEDRFFADSRSLNIELPDVITRATEFIDKMVLFIQDLEKRGFAYRANDGSIYFSISKLSRYGELSRLNKEGIQIGARVNQDEYLKENPVDFALWKAWSEDDGEIYWETSLGKGRPGWHIECSTMAQDTLGDTIDIHAGGVDLIFPHHENEIAQSEARSGKKFVNFWVHGEHLLVENQKMSKSLGNLYTLEDLKEKGFSPLDFRYLILGANYRTKLNFTWEGLKAAKNTRERLMRILSEASPEANETSEKYLRQFEAKVSDDLDTPGALSVMWEMLRDSSLKDTTKYNTAIKMDTVLGLDLKKHEKVNIPEEIISLAEDRKKAKIAGDYAVSDKMRGEIEKKGYKVEDLPDNKYKISRGNE